jgi:hypothetical protein
MQEVIDENCESFPDSNRRDRLYRDRYLPCNWLPIRAKEDAFGVAMEERGRA